MKLAQLIYTLSRSILLRTDTTPESAQDITETMLATFAGLNLSPHELAALVRDAARSHESKIAAAMKRLDANA